MATTVNSITSARGERNRYGPQLPVIEHPLTRLGNKSELKIRGASANYNSSRPTSHQYDRSTNQNLSKSIHVKFDDDINNQNHNVSEENDLPPLRTENNQNLPSRKHQRLSTWPGSILDNVPRHKMNAPELIQLIREKIPTSFHGIKQAFKASDPYGKGNAPREAMGRIIYHLCGYLFPGQIASLLKSLNLSKKKAISFDEFIAAIKDTESSNHVAWVDPVQRLNNKPELAPVEWTATQVQAHLRNRALDGTLALYDILPLECLVENGQILKPQFRIMLENLKISMTDFEFEKLWDRCDLHGVGGMKTGKVFRRLGIDYDKLLDITAARSKSRQSSDEKPSGQDASKKQPQKLIKKICAALQRLVHKLEEPFEDLIQEFQKYDHDKIGKVTRQNFRTIINNYFKLKLSPIDLEYFLQSQPDPVPVKSNYVDLHTSMMAEAKIAQILHKKFISILEKFRVFDSEKCGLVNKYDFRLCLESILSNSLTDSEFDELLHSTEIEELRGIDYPRFLTLLDDA
ncbi:uncharacterized protein TRIADDRAFT_54775 [Trichoplax adhaerens]|uniref:EF-hand domain-containing protein n=1 Tax=Trichoplax adhaerens TaxID=10228 RepID=B3RSY8_TRIAD|nr:hypothetical protein TRIADDRAFT_54775 [Trichoplax adhaerens]EDV27131.1 hypothetical protein TRIADDRAFT_54775 [Trichoplax adhaerens]|eukprot:XP_002111127.1 hypothetical protein TRIADDRAFT_54775 [Trichoplax adhaerens]